MYELLCHVILYHPETAIDAVNVTPSRYGDDIELGLWLVEEDNLKMQSEIDWTLTLFMLSLFFTSRADWWSVDNQISSLISLNVVTLEKAVVTVQTRKLDMTYVWMEICR